MKKLFALLAIVPLMLQAGALSADATRPDKSLSASKGVGHGSTTHPVKGTRPVKGTGRGKGVGSVNGAALSRSAGSAASVSQAASADLGTKVKRTKRTRTPASAPVEWMGRSWWPRSVSGGPGVSGLWSPANATVDAEGRVHLRITRDRKGRLVQGELDTMDNGWGYGTYRWEVASDLTNLHPEVVLGLFTYGADPAYGHREIDIEAAGWGTTPITWDYTTWANGHNPVARTPVAPGRSTHQFEWAPDHITWTSWDADGVVLATRTVTGADVPVPYDESIGMNLWVCGCTGDWKQTPETEAVIDSFTFTPFTS